jgi:hypothetical protein
LPQIFYSLEMSSTQHLHSPNIPATSSWSADGNCSRLSELLDGIRTGSLLHLTELKLSGCGLTALPPEICQLRMLEKLDLGGNLLSDLPSDFSNLVSLQILFFLNNRFSVVPEVDPALVSIEISRHESIPAQRPPMFCLPLLVLLM